MNLSKQLGLILFDKENPEMITKVVHQEIDLFSNLIILTENENDLRLELGIESPNILEKVLKENLVIRTSLKGWRSEQGERIITSNIERDTDIKSGFLGKLGRNVK